MEKKNEKNSASTIPESTNTKAMDSKKDVEQSNDEKTDQDFPGYPHYPAKEDMMDQRTDNHKADIDVENLPDSNNESGVDQRFTSGQDKKKAENAMTSQPVLGDNELNLKSGTEADVSDEDLTILNSTNAEIGTPQNVTNEDLDTDLDIPGSELDDENEAIGEEDEENNYYSLGGDNHENLEEDPSENW